MKIYDMFDEENNTSVGVLCYYEKSGACIIELCENLDEWTAPLLFTSYVRRGIYTILQDISLIWVRERVIPSGRQNIGSILSHHRLKEYDEMKLLELSGGRCSQDSLCIRRLDEIPEYVAARAAGNVTECIVNEMGYLICFFADGSVKKVDLQSLGAEDGVDKVLRNRDVLRSGKVGVGGYSVIFNDSIEISARLLYSVGQKLSLTKEDFDTFVTRNILDTTDCCNMMDCSRQNIAYMVNEGQITPVKENVRGNLYLKGDVLRNMW